MLIAATFAPVSPPFVGFACAMSALVPNPNAIVPIATAFITAPSRINFILFTASLLEANTHQASPAFQTKTHLNLSGFSGRSALPEEPATRVVF
jgi:hypothetical protein